MYTITNSGTFYFNLTEASITAGTDCLVHFTNEGYLPYREEDYQEAKKKKLLCVRNPKLVERSLKAQQRDMNHRHYLRAKSLASSFKKVEPRAVSSGKMH